MDTLQNAIQTNTKLTYKATDLHTHTCASGHGTLDRITDLAKEAAKRRMEVLGISDHGPASVKSEAKRS